MARPKGRARRVKCPICHAEIAVKVDNRVFRHAWLGGDQRRAVCPGTDMEVP